MNYSEYIKSKYGFVESYEVKGEELLVKTPATKKDKPHKFNATKENTTYYDSRLGHQYKLLIKHQEEIIQDKSRKARKVIYLLAAVLLITTAGLNILNLSEVYTTILGAAGFSTILVGEISLASSIVKFKEKMAMYKYYIDNRTDIEQQSREDKNIVEYLNEETKTKIQSNEELQQQGKIEDVFNIDLMDKISLEQLKELLVRYKISQKLQEELTFSLPKQEKTKKLTPNNK